MNRISGNRNSLKVRINEELMCGICHECLRQPKILTQCSHTFCQICLEKTFAYKMTSSGHEDQLECPKCRQITILPPSRIAGLPTNYTLQSMAEIISEEPDDEQEHEPEAVCRQHQRTVDQYCSACNELLCSECVHDPKHKEHLQKEKIHLAHKILPEQLDTLSRQLEPARSLVTQAEQMKQQLEKKKEAIVSNREETKETIDAYFKEARKQLEDRSRALMSAVDENAKSKLSVLEERGHELKESEVAAVRATEAINRLCQTRDIHGLVEGPGICEEIQQCEQSLQKLDAELQNQSLNLLLKFKEDKILQPHLSTLGKLIEYQCDPSLNYLIVKRHLTISRDGKVFQDTPVPPTIQAPYVMVAEGDEGYVYSRKYGMTQSVSNPESIAQPVIFPAPGSPPANQLYQNTYFNTPATQSILPPQQSPRLPARFRARSSTSPIHRQFQPEVQRHPRPPPVTGDEALYDKVPLRLQNPPLPPPRPPSDNDDGVYEKMYTGSNKEGSDSGSDSEGEYEPISGWGPPLPPDNSARNLARQEGRRSRAKTMPYNRPSQQPSDRPEPIIIKPMQVIDTNQLRHQSCGDKVYPVGIHCASGSDNILITDVHNHCLRQLDEEGTFIEAIGSEGKDDKQFTEPTAIAIDAGYMYITDLAANGRVQRFSRYGLFINKFGKRRLRKPYSIAISQKDQSIYISDCRKRRVYIYDRNCKYVGSIGKAEEVVKLNYPVGIVFDTAGNLLVVDRGQQCACIWQIDISKPKGEVIAKIGEGYLHCPFGIAVTRDGSIIVTEQGKMNCVSVFSSHGKVIRCFGGPGSSPGLLNSPSGVTVNSKGHIIVADTYNQRLQVFSLHNGENDSEEGV